MGRGLNEFMGCGHCGHWRGYHTPEFGCTRCVWRDMGAGHLPSRQTCREFVEPASEDSRNSCRESEGMTPNKPSRVVEAGRH